MSKKDKKTSPDRGFEKSNSKARNRQQFLRVLQGPLGFAGALVALALIGGLIIWGAGDDGDTPVQTPETLAQSVDDAEETTATNKPVSGKSDFATMLEKGDVDELLTTSQTLHESLKDASLPDQLASLRAKMAIADRLEEIEKERSITIDDARIIRLETLGMWDSLNRRNELSDSPAGDVRGLAKTLLDDKNPKVARTATSSLLLSLSDAYAKSQDESALAEFTEFGMEAIKKYGNDVDAMTQIFQMLRIVAFSGDGPELVQKDLVIQFADELLKNPNKSVKLLGNRLYDATLFQKDNIENIVFQVEIGDQDSLRKGMALVEKSKTISNLGIAIFYHGIRLADACLRNGFEEQADKIENDLELALANQSLDVKKYAIKFLNNLRTRRQLIGKKINLKALDLQGTPIDFSTFEGSPVVICFFELGVASRDALESLHESAVFHQDGMKFIGICANPRRIQSDSNLTRATQAYHQLKRIYQHVQFVPVSGSFDFLSQCPIQTAPYVFILDSKHQVIANNIKPDEIRSTIENGNWWYNSDSD